MGLKIPFGDYNTLVDALETWGRDEQFGMANEEFGECITAMNQFKRGRISKAELASEVSDVFIMASQLAIIAGESDVQEQVEYKMRRLRLRLDSFLQNVQPGTSQSV